LAVKTLKFRVFLKSVAENLFSIMLARIGFWSGGLHDFRSNDSQTRLDPVADDSDRKWLVVVGREHYFESVKDYPIGHVGDLKKLLKNEPWRFPYKGVRLNRVERLTDQSHRVTSWVIKQEVLGGLSARPLWILPESVCLEVLLDNSVLELDRLGKKVHVAVTADGLLSSLGQEGSFNSRLGSGWASPELGGRSSAKLEGSAAVESILLGVMRSLRSAPFQFFIGFDKEKISSYQWLNSIKLSAAIGLTYLAITTGYLLIAQAWVDFRLAASTLKSEPSMLIRKDLAGYRARVDEFTEAMQGTYPMWVAWDVLLDLKDIGVAFRAVNSTPPLVTYYLTAANATDVLAWLAKDPRVVNAEFALPVRKVGGADQFAIKITLQEAPTDSKQELINGG
jgi:hypothetical protein